MGGAWGLPSRQRPHESDFFNPIFLAWWCIFAPIPSSDPRHSSAEGNEGSREGKGHQTGTNNNYGSSSLPAALILLGRPRTIALLLPLLAPGDASNLRRLRSDKDFPLHLLPPQSFLFHRTQVQLKPFLISPYNTVSQTRTPPVTSLCFAALLHLDHLGSLPPSIAPARTAPHSHTASCLVRFLAANLVFHSPASWFV